MTGLSGPPIRPKQAAEIFGTQHLANGVVAGARVCGGRIKQRWHAIAASLMRARSYESEVFFIFAHPARSLITDPEGKVALKDDSPAPYAVTELGLSVVDRVRSAAHSHLKDRRPDLCAS